MHLFTELDEQQLRDSYKITSIWHNSAGKPCYLVIKNDLVYMYHCPVCGHYPSWASIHTGTCPNCKCKDGRGFKIDRNNRVAILFKYRDMELPAEPIISQE